jgi:hypothetical protein
MNQSRVDGMQGVRGSNPRTSTNSTTVLLLTIIVDVPLVLGAPVVNTIRGASTAPAQNSTAPSSSEYMPSS